MGQLFSACSKDGTYDYEDEDDRAPLKSRGSSYGSTGGAAGAGGARGPGGGGRINALKNDDPFGIRSPSLYVSRTPMDAATAAAKGKGRKRGSAAALAARQRQRKAEKRLSAELDGQGACGRIVSKNIFDHV